LRQQIGTAGEEKFNVARFSASDPAYANHPALQPFTDQGSVAANTALYDITRANPPVLPPRNVRPIAAATSAATLQEVANGVVTHPTGEDEGIFTKVVRWGLYHGQAHLFTTEDVMSIANNPNNFCPPPDKAGQPLARLNVLPAGAGTHEWDQESRDRVQAISRPW
jgi:hypothetical protein